jgi:hypothetical protein
MTYKLTVTDGKLIKIRNMEKYLVFLIVLIFSSCQSNNNKDRVAHQEALSKEFKSRQNDKIEYTKVHDSLARIAEYKKNALLTIDSIWLNIEDIKAKYNYEQGSIPKKVELNLMRIEERTNDLRSKIKYSNDASENWTGFQEQVDKEFTIIKSNLNKL